MEDLYPLTPTQEGMLFRLLHAEDSGAYLEQVRCDLIGDLDSEALRASWEATVRHHPALRTAFIWSGVKKPIQVVRQTVKLPWETHDWRDRRPAEVREDLDAFARSSRRQPFDPQRAPGLRFHLFLLDDRRSHLLWEFNHMVLDGWSATIVFDEALARYGRGALFEERAARPFRRYLEWLQDQDREAAENYWTALLSDVGQPATLQLARAAVDDRFSLGRLERTLPSAELRRLEDFARSQRLTLSTLVQGAWAAVLSRYTDRDDVTFGVVTSGRPADLDGVEEIVGMFLSALPMRVRQNGGEPTVEWLRAMQDQQLGTTRFQYASPVDIRRWAGLPPNQELFESVVVFQGHPPLQALLEDRSTGEGSQDPAPEALLEVAAKTVHEQTHYDLTLLVRPDDRLHLSVLYDRNRLYETDVSDLIDLVVATLDRLTWCSTMGEVDALLPAHDRLIAEANRTDRAFDADATLTDLLRSVAGQRPEHPALIEDTSGRGDGARSSMTHGQLDAASDAVAESLIATGVKAGDAVGVAIDRSVALVVALLGVWKAGAAYVPLDRSAPPRRLALMVERAGIDLVLVSDVFEELPHGVRTMTVHGTEHLDGPAPRPPVSPDSPACVIFTSGSTGEPKAVELSHRNIVNRCQWQLATYPVDDGERCVAKTTLGFVDHLWELWGPLLGGATLVLLSEHAARDPRALLDALETHGARRLTLVPSLLEVMLDEGTRASEALGSLSWVTVSGEETTPALAERFDHLLPHATLLNFYGMSEGTADATWFDTNWYDAAWFDAGRRRVVPIGRPIANTTVQVLDRRGRPSPVGVTGHIHVEGVGVALGYRFSPDLTAERFGASDLGPSRRTYDTGDLGRWRPDGLLEYAGRADLQLKIRGVRIEPAEVITALRSHPDVQQAVVTTDRIGRQTRLIAYAVSTAAVDPGELREHLRSLLPAASLPSLLHVIDRLPTLPSGKTDWSALAVQTVAPRTGPDEPDTPRTDDERAMVALWQEVLQLDTVGLGDDFFEVGGDSLLAVRLFSAVDRQFGRDLPLATLFEAPTPRAMLARLALVDADDADLPAPAPLFLLAPPGATVRHFAALTRRLEDSATVVVLDAARPIDELMVEIAEWEAALGRPPDGPLEMGGHGGASAQAVDLCRRLRRLGRSVDTLLLIDADVTFDALGTTPTPSTAPTRLVFLEPAEAEGPIPMIAGDEIRLRLDDRARWTAWTPGVETVLVPGERSVILSEPAVGWLGHLCSDHLIGSSGRWTHLVPISMSPSPTRRLFAVHGEFGNVVGYRDLAVSLGPDWEVVGVQASGVHGTRPLHRSIEEMAAAYREEILALQPEGPYLLAGYSSGGTVASEIARQLEASGHTVEGVLWFDHFRHGTAEEDQGLRRAVRLGISRLRTAVFDRKAFLEGLERRRLDRLAEQFDQGPSDPARAVASDTWWWAITELANDRADAENLRSTLIASNMRNARSDYHAPPYQGPIVLYQADVLGPGRAADRGWSELELQLTRVRVPGDHASLLLAPNCEAIATDLKQRYPAGLSPTASVVEVV